MTKIVRTPTKVSGGITAEEREKMRELSDLWIKRSYRTDPIEPEKITAAIKDLYRVSGLKEPRVVIAPSPRVMAFAGGFASAIWWLRKNPDNPFSTRAATDAATRDATRDATRAATDAATRAATYDATDAATHDATDDATELVRFFIGCAQRWYGPYQGGNMWAAWAAYMSAFRDVLGLRLPQHQAYKAWEDAAIHGGFRWVHEEFCMVSDFPETIKIDADHRPHCEDGPSHRWRDGWELYHWHGIRTTEQVIMRPETITAQQVQAEENAELRRVMVERMGWERYCDQAKMRLVHSDHLDTNFPTLPISEIVDNGSRLVTEFRSGREVAELLEAGELLDFEDRPMRFVRLTDPSTGRQYVLRVKHDHRRCYEAVGWTVGLSEEEYKSAKYLRQGDIALVPLNPATLPQQQHS